MASIIAATFIPLLFFGIIIIAFIVSTTANTQKKTTKPKQYTSNNKNIHQYQQQHHQQQHHQQQPHMPQFNPKMEIDLRLPYRRFKQIYPNSEITYDEYKKIQVQSSFKRAISSQKNHRMVR